MAKVNRIGVIDIGFTKIATLVAEAEISGEFQISSWDVRKAEGFKNGMVVNLDKALATLRSSIESLEGGRFNKLPVYVGIQGSYIRYTPTSADIRRRNPAAVISEREINQAKKEAHSLKPPAEESFLHLVPVSYTLDNIKGIQNPKNFRNCHLLKLEALLIHCKSLVLSNLEQLLGQLRIRNWYFVFQPLATSLVAAEPENKEVGCALIDLGGRTVISIYKDGELQHFRVIEIGGEEISKDLSFALRVSKEVGDNLKERFGGTKAAVADKDEVIPLPDASGEEKNCSRRIIAEIMECRLEELLFLCREEIESCGYSHSLSSGVILVGGGAKIPGIVSFAHNILGLPVRIGTPGKVKEEFSDPSLVSALGLAKFGLGNFYKKYALVEEEDIITKGRQLIKRVFHITGEE